MKQKIVIQVQMRCKKCRVKTMEVVATTPGVESVAMGGDGTITVMGDDVDLVSTVSALRKKVGSASVVSVEEVNEVQNQDSGTTNNANRIESHPPCPYNYMYDAYPPRHCTGYVVTDMPISYNNTPTCNIM